MLTIELLEESLELARRAGYRVRQEWLDGACAGACVIKGQKWLFLDPNLSPRRATRRSAERPVGRSRRGGHRLGAGIEAGDAEAQSSVNFSVNGWPMQTAPITRTQ